MIGEEQKRRGCEKGQLVLACYKYNERGEELQVYGVPEVHVIFLQPDHCRAAIYYAVSQRLGWAHGIINGCPTVIVVTLYPDLTFKQHYGVPASHNYIQNS